jgi:hypothetical protein
MARQPKRFVISSDKHEFIGRIMDLSVVGTHFESYDEGARYQDVKYVFDVNDRLSLLMRRVESLNHVGDLLWPKSPISGNLLPVSIYEYSALIQDAFLMRIVSTLDCCCLLAVEVLELGMKPRQANPTNIRKLSQDHPCCEKLDNLSDLQRDLRAERNIRFHRGEEEALTDDDLFFQIVAQWSSFGKGISGVDRYGRKISLQRWHGQAIRHLRAKFRKRVKALDVALDDFYDCMLDEFESRFHSKFQDTGSFGRRQFEEDKERKPII